jgi:hypothetical protein
MRGDRSHDDDQSALPACREIVGRRTESAVENKIDRGETAMLTLQETSSSHDASVAGKPNNPVCPTCQRAMTVKEIMPVSAIGVGGTAYICDVCGTETHRTAKPR